MEFWHFGKSFAIKPRQCTLHINFNFMINQISIRWGKCRYSANWTWKYYFCSRWFGIESLSFEWQFFFVVIVVIVVVFVVEVVGVVYKTSKLHCKILNCCKRQSKFLTLFHCSIKATYFQMQLQKFQNNNKNWPSKK